MQSARHDDKLRGLWPDRDPDDPSFASPKRPAAVGYLAATTKTAAQKAKEAAEKAGVTVRVVEQKPSIARLE